MKVRITDDNLAALTKAIATAQSARCEVNVVTPERLLQMATKAEQRILALLPKSHAAGVAYEYAAAGPASKSYRYQQGATSIRMERGAEHWFLTDVQRIQVWPEQHARDALIVQPAQRAKAIDRFLAEARIEVAPAAKLSAVAA
jgi:hypothetical protein